MVFPLGFLSWDVWFVCKNWAVGVPRDPRVIALHISALSGLRWGAQSKVIYMFRTSVRRSSEDLSFKKVRVCGKSLWHSVIGTSFGSSVWTCLSCGCSGQGRSMNSFWIWINSSGPFPLLVKCFALVFTIYIFLKLIVWIFDRGERDLG